MPNPPPDTPATSPALHHQLQRVLRLYRAQLEHIGRRAFVLQAHGPFGTGRDSAAAVTRIGRSLEVLDTATGPELDRLLALLLASDFYEAYRYLNETIWPRSLHAQGNPGTATRLLPVNPRPYRPAPRPQPARPERSYTTAVPAGPANQQALVVVSAANWCRLTLPVLSAAGLEWGDEVQLVVPTKRGGQWYLDTKPRPGAGRQLPAAYKPLLFRVPPIPRWHFHETRATHGPRGAVGRPITGVTNTQVARRYFRLGAEHPEHPGYFLLEPVVGKAGAGL